METTRHFVTTVYLVNDDRTALHKHKKLGLLLPPGGHIDRDELPHIAGEREVYEETGINIDINEDRQIVKEGAWSRKIPQPDHLLLDDITIKDGDPSHQHINFVYFVEVDNDNIDPQGHSEVDSEDWYWFDIDDLESDDLPMDLDKMTKKLGIEAIENFS